jgi:hypothetical protein
MVDGFFQNGFSFWKNRFGFLAPNYGRAARKTIASQDRRFVAPTFHIEEAGFAARWRAVLR